MKHPLLFAAVAAITLGSALIRRSCRLPPRKPTFQKFQRARDCFFPDNSL